jgi:hypothetical protein
MSRHPDAIPQLASVFRSAQGQSFRWGWRDCCQFAARAVHALTGRDPREIFPRYRTKAQAQAIIDECGSLEGVVRRALRDYPQIHPSRATLGNIVLCDFGRGPQPAVCAGAYCLAPGRRGIERRMTLDAIAAWDV